MSQNFFKMLMLVRALKKEGINIEPFIQMELREAMCTTTDPDVQQNMAQHINSIKVKVADEALLSSNATSDSYSWCQGGHHHYRRVYGVWSDKDYYRFEPSRKYGSGGGDWGEDNAPTIGEQIFTMEPQLKKLGKSLKPDFFVVVVKHDHDDWGNGTVTREVTVYKTKKFDIEGYFARQIDEAARELKAELARITG